MSKHNSTKGKVLVTGGSHAEIPLINSLHGMGYEVITTGTNRDGLGHKLADLYISADFSNVDAVLEIATKNEVVGIVSGCNDFAYLSAAYASEKLGLKGHDGYATACSFHHKDAFRKALQDCGLPYPQYMVCEKEADVCRAAEVLALPVIVKPTDLTGGKGVAVCHSWEEVIAQYRIALDVTRRAQIVIEEYIEGANHGVSALIADGKVVFSFFDNEEYWLNPYLVSGAYSPSDLTDSQREEIKRQIQAVAKAFNLCDGLFHCQCILDKNGTPYLIDPCRRAPGDLYIQLVSYATGVDYPRMIVQSELGLPFTQELQSPLMNRSIARECVMACTNGVVNDIRIAPSYREHIIDELWWGGQGDEVDDCLKYKAGILFFEYQNAVALKEAMRELRKNVVVEVSKR